jgi:hypothetical protein
MYYDFSVRAHIENAWERVAGRKQSHTFKRDVPATPKGDNE